MGATGSRASTNSFAQTLRTYAGWLTSIRGHSSLRTMRLRTLDLNKHVKDEVLSLQIGGYICYENIEAKNDR